MGGFTAKNAVTTLMLYNVLEPARPSRLEASN